MCCPKLRRAFSDFGIRIFRDRRKLRDLVSLCFLKNK